MFKIININRIYYRFFVGKMEQIYVTFRSMAVIVLIVVYLTTQSFAGGKNYILRKLITFHYYGYGSFIKKSQSSYKYECFAASAVFIIYNLTFFCSVKKVENWIQGHYKSILMEINKKIQHKSTIMFFERQK